MAWDKNCCILGPAGVAGANGLDGAAGPQGPAGNDGAAGPQGLAGNDGAVGPQGPPGDSLFTLTPGDQIVPVEQIRTLQITGGSATSPAYGCIGGIGTGISFPSTTELQLNTENVARLTINSAGGWNVNGSTSEAGLVLTGNGWAQPPSFQPPQGVPAGTIVMYTASTAPFGWTICDGSNGSPDLRDRFVIASGNSFGLGQYGGSATSTLPYHGHGGTSVDAVADASGNGANMYGGGMGYALNGINVNRGAIGVGVSPEGVDPTNGNIPPFVCLTFIMKLGNILISKSRDGIQADTIEHVALDPPFVTSPWVPPASEWKPPAIEVPAFIPANDVTAQAAIASS